MPTDPEGYKYDVFLSYLRTDPSGENATTYTWVRKYLYPELKKWLPHCVPPGRQTPIFWDDKSIKVGTEWPKALQDALSTSRCLLAVLSSQYFGSQWCQAEWNTMLERRKSLNVTSGLIYAIVLSGKEFFPETVRTIQMKDLSRFNRTDLAFERSSAYGRFQATIRNGVCKDLSKMILEAPTWDKNWRVVIPEEILRKNVELPQL